MDQTQALMFIHSNGYPRLWSYNAEKEEWTFVIRPWLTIRLNPDSVKPSSMLSDALAETSGGDGNAGRTEEAEYSLFERETPVLTARLLRLPGGACVPLPSEETGEISRDDYRFARCLERPDVSGGLPLDGILQRLGWTVAGQ